jgi:DNA-binding winged helix-turn-helix (wHTH) protein
MPLVSSGLVYAFGPFRLDTRSNELTRGGERIAISDRHISVLQHLVANAGSIASKEVLITAAWEDVAVTDNSLEQVISALRRLLGDGPGGRPYLETVPRRGYRFAGEVSRLVRRESDQALDALLAPHRAWIEGRAALETFERDQIIPAREAFETALRSASDEPSAHVGMANACMLQFETTRADESRDTAALAKAVHHAREACRLDAGYAEAWATLGFVLDRTGSRVDALAASRRAVTLEPDNWRHHFRLAFVGWGEERLREARRTLALLPGFPSRALACRHGTCGATGARRSRARARCGHRCSRQPVGGAVTLQRGGASLVAGPSLFERRRRGSRARGVRARIVL